jgi:hypothetical protein
MAIERANGPAHTGSRLQRSIGAHVPLFKTLRVSEHVEHAGPHHGCDPANAFVFFLAIEATLFPSLRRHPGPHSKPTPFPNFAKPRPQNPKPVARELPHPKFSASPPPATARPTAQGRAGKIRGPVRNPKIGPIIIKFNFFKNC